MWLISFDIVDSVDVVDINIDIVDIQFVST